LKGSGKTGTTPADKSAPGVSSGSAISGAPLLALGTAQFVMVITLTRTTDSEPPH
jgi:hypothetical protein